MSDSEKINSSIWLRAFSSISSSCPNLLLVDRCSSTMDLGRSVLAAQPLNYLVRSASSYTACFALAQENGRGRRARDWYSVDSDGLYLTLVDSRHVRLESLQGFSLAIGIAVLRCLKKFGLSPTLKWPNDIFLGGKKSAGILVETVPARDNLSSILIGVGLNINQRSFPSALNATSMFLETGESQDYEKVAIELVYQMISVIEQFEKEGFGGLKAEWWDNSLMKNKLVENIELGIVGQAIGINDTGALIVDTDSGIKEIHVGDVGVVL